MSSTDKKAGDTGQAPGGDSKESGGISASDLRARLGLKSGKGTPPPKAGGIMGGPPGALTTAPIDRGVLAKLRSGNNEAVKAPVTGESATQALSLDDFDELVDDDLHDEPATVVAPSALQSQMGVKAALGSGVPDDLDAALDAALDGFGSTDLPVSAPAAAKPAPVPASPASKPVVAPKPQAAPPRTEPDDSGQSIDVLESSLVEVIEDEPASADEPAVADADELLGAEKTSLLDTGNMFGNDSEDFDAFPEGEKTQIVMSAMEHEPLTGRLIIEAGDAPQREYVLARDKTTIGRGTKNGIVIPDIAMSRQHLSFERFTEGFTVRDLESGNGTVVNGHRIIYAELRTGDIVEAGNIRLRFEQSGGDPDKLWKGGPKVQYHPKDTGPAQNTGLRAAPAAPSAAVASSGPQSAASGPQPQSLLQSSVHQYAQPGMPPGTGMYGAPWTQPQMGYPPGYPGMPAAQRKGSPVITALIVFFSILLLGLVGLIVWSLVGQKAPQQVEKKVEETPEEKKARAAQYVNEGSTFFDQRRWEDARQSFLRALELEPDNVTAKMFVEEIIDREKLTEEQIMKAMGDIKAQPTAANYKKAMQILSSIDAESSFASEVRTQHLPAVKRNYRKLLLRDARKAVDENNLAKAKVLLLEIRDELSEGKDQEVEDLLKIVETKRKAP